MLFNLVQSEYHLIDAFSYFIAAAVPIYFLIKSRNSVNNPLRKVMVILAGFVMAQGVYHIAGVLGLNLISKVILEPLSAAVLVSAALVYFLTRRRMLKQEVYSYYWWHWRSSCIPLAFFHWHTHDDPFLVFICHFRHTCHKKQDYQKLSISNINICRRLCGRRGIGTKWNTECHTDAS
jgi:hypothetical protein